jgi:hypothetical protein
MMFGQTPLTLFDWEAHQKRMRRYKQEALQKMESEQKPINQTSVIKTY